MQRGESERGRSSFVQHRGLADGKSDAFILLTTIIFDGVSRMVIVVIPILNPNKEPGWQQSH